ncbi:unnamed protein product, partial [Allacma fusca]
VEAITGFEDAVRKAEAAEDLKKCEDQAKINAANPNPNQPPAASQGQKPKLPQLTLPTFLGYLEDWLSFRDSFNQVVHRRTDLSGAEKLSYLFSDLESPALETIQAIPMEDKKYNDAYTRLTEQFEHTRRSCTGTLMRFSTSYNKPNKANLLLATDFYFNIIRSVVVRVKENEPVAHESVLGWLVGGGRATARPTKLICNNLTVTIDQRLQQFWEVEHLPTEKALTQEEQLCEHHFQTTTTRLENGSYKVELTLKKSPRYWDTRGPWQPRGSTKRPACSPEHASYNLPHHAIIKPSSTTNKCRVVFDARPKTTATTSLNDQLIVGPVLQDDLHTLLVRWRFWMIQLVADITQMYLQIWVHSSTSIFSG